MSNASRRIGKWRTYAFYLLLYQCEFLIAEDEDEDEEDEDEDEDEDEKKKKEEEKKQFDVTMMNENVT